MKKSSKEVVDLTVSAMYPDVKLDDKSMDAVILATLRPELKGLQPEGFVDGMEFRPERFHLSGGSKMIAETWLTQRTETGSCLTNISTVTWTVSASRLSLSVLVLLIGIPSLVLTPWSKCSKKSASRCIGGSGKKLLNKSLFALLIHLFILFLQ